MTVAEFKRDGATYEANITGHAGYNPGQDIVCAACSSLAYTLLNAAMRAADSGDLSEASYKEDDGALLVRVCAKDHAVDRIDAIWETIAGGYAILAERYPDNVAVKYSTSQTG